MQASEDAAGEPDVSPERHVSVNERAAIMKHDSGLPREWAELLARFDPVRPPPNVSPREWLEYVNACGQLADGWALRIAELGWRPHEALGCSGRGLFPYMGRASLAWLLACMPRDYRLTALDDEEAIVTRPNGTQLALRRVAGRLDLVWQFVH